MFKKGDYIYYINKHGAHIPGKVLSVRNRIKCVVDDPECEGERVSWLSPTRLELQDPNQGESL